MKKTKNKFAVCVKSDWLKNIFKPFKLSILNLFLILVICVIGNKALAMDNGLAKTPPMGFNTFNWFHGGFDETIIKQITDAMVSSGMKNLGYQFVNIDGGWWPDNILTSDGHMNVDMGRFPSGAKGMADYVHSKGLKFGWYIRPEIAYKDIIAQELASWGVDYIKSDTYYQTDQAHKMLFDAITATGRPMVFSMHGNESVCDGLVYKDWSNLWRIHDDIGANWASVMTSMDAAVNSPNCQQYVGPGHWADADMLQVGCPEWNSKIYSLTLNENRTHFTMWCILAQPLIVGYDIRRNEPQYMEILLNSEAIAVDQDPLGYPGKKVVDNGDLEIFSKILQDGSRAVALLNRSASTANITVNWSDIGLASGNAQVRDLWEHKNKGIYSTTYTANVASHEAKLLKIISGAPIVPVTGVIVSPTSVTIYGTGTQQLTATVSPTNASDENVIWSSSNTSVASVDINGLITGVAAGNATITATTRDGSKIATSVITVIPISVTGVSINPSQSAINVNGTQQLTAVVSPATSTNKIVSWISSNTSVAAVNSSGLVTGVAAGNATITVTTQDGGKTATSAITVSSGGGTGLYAYEGFNYSAGNLSGQNGGAGWSTPWTSTGTVATPGLTYTGCTSVGNKGVFTTQDGSRTTSQTLGGNGQTVWMGFILFESGNGTIFNIELRDESTCQMDFLKNAYNHWGIDNLGTTYTGNLPWTNEKTVNHFWLFKMVFDSSNAAVTVWRDPSLGSEPTGGTTITIPTFTFNNFYISASASSPSIDELRIGSTFNDVINGSGGVSTDINTNEGNQGVLIYKNANNLIAVNCKDIIGSDAVVSVYNSAGQKLASKQMTGTTTVIDKTFNPGVYVVTVNNAGISTTRKVILN